MILLHCWVRCLAVMASRYQTSCPFRTKKLQAASGHHLASPLAVLIQPVLPKAVVPGHGLVCLQAASGHHLARTTRNFWLNECSSRLWSQAVTLSACRLPFAQVQQLQPEGMKALTVTTTQLTKMKANTVDAPYIVEKGSPTVWRFTLAYSTVDSLMPLVHEQLAISRLPYGERAAALQVRRGSLQCVCVLSTARGFRPKHQQPVDCMGCKWSLATHNTVNNLRPTIQKQLGVSRLSYRSIGGG